ncbi:MAG: DUF1273 domain-containing protein, partial [Oscillospiraceae bacterium]|nr:DUF1273 domain-containing protein [Oscillospiraceae bacterium]
MNAQKICCFTGHRKIAEDQWDNLINQLRSEVQKAVDDGYTTFISGFAQGADLLFAEVVLDLKKDNPHLFLEAAIPYANR